MKKVISARCMDSAGPRWKMQLKGDSPSVKREMGQGTGESPGNGGPALQGGEEDH